MIRFIAIAASALFLSSCASTSDQYACGVADGLGCTKASEVYRIKVLGEGEGVKSGTGTHKPGTPIEIRPDGTRVLTQGDKIDRALHSFEGSVQNLGDKNPLMVRPMTRDPIYRTIYIPGETVITSSGKPMRAMPRVIVVEQVKGGFIDGPFDGEYTMPNQYQIPIQSQYMKAGQAKSPAK